MATRERTYHICYQKLSETRHYAVTKITVEEVLVETWDQLEKLMRPPLYQDELYGVISDYVAAVRHFKERRGSQ